MKLTKLLKYQLKGSYTLLYVCIMFPVMLFFMHTVDVKNEKKRVDKLVQEYGSIERVIEEAPAEYDSLISGTSMNGTIMLCAGLFGGSIGMIVELFGVAMQMGITRKTIKWTYIIYAVFFSVFISLVIWGSDILVKEYMLSQCTGNYELLKPKYESIDTGLLQLGKYMLMGVPVMITGASFWLITTRIKKAVLWVIAIVVLLFLIITGVALAVAAEMKWLMITILGVGALIMFVIYFILINTETIEHKLR